MLATGKMLLGPAMGRNLLGRVCVNEQRRMASGAVSLAFLQSVKIAFQPNNSPPAIKSTPGTQPPRRPLLAHYPPPTQGSSGRPSQWLEVAGRWTRLFSPRVLVVACGIRPGLVPRSECRAPVAPRGSKAGGENVGCTNHFAQCPVIHEFNARWLAFSCAHEPCARAERNQRDSAPAGCAQGESS